MFFHTGKTCGLRFLKILLPKYTARRWRGVGVLDGMPKDGSEFVVVDHVGFAKVHVCRGGCFGALSGILFGE